MSDERVRPARPHHKLTEDGRPLREVLSYSRRGARFTPRQAAAWAAYAERWWLPDEAVDDPGFTLAGMFGRTAPLVVEIGSGIGESTVALAATRPDHDVVAFEVWRPGVADTLSRIGEAGLSNVRMLSVDAVWSMEHLVEPGALAALWTFFPDPWHKKKHHKRRLVTPSFARLAATRLAPGAEWRLATDWADYAEQMVEVLDAEPLLDGGVTGRWAERPVTKFERKGLAAGREITDLRYSPVQQ
jgi:tRNA (guanine-N7-)-methyltransferase